MNLRNREILRIALPSIVSNITVPLLGLIDVAITGHLGSSVYLGAIAVGGMLFNIIYWMFAFLRMGTSGMTAQARGRRDFTEAVRLLVNSVGLALAASVLLLVLSPLIREAALLLIAPSPEVAEYARIYFNICILGAPASLALFALNGWFLGMQNSRLPMVIAIGQNVLNIMVSLLLVYGLGMKVEGVALGTVVAQWGGCITAAALLATYYRRILAGRLSMEMISVKRLKTFFSVNRDIFLRTLCLIAVHFFFISVGARQGDIHLAVNTLMMQLFTLYSYFMDGFAFAGEAMAGKAYGARNRVAYNETVRLLLRWGLAVTLLFTVMYALFGRPFLSMLTDDAAVTSAAMDYHVWAVLIPACGMLAFVWDGIYIGITATRQMLLSTFAGLAVFVSLFLLLFPLCHNHGLWIAYNANLLTRGLVLWLLHRPTI